ncbi:VWA domain-containing protein [Stenotrophomonas sp. Iso1]|uniref:vWA domain-containing protein n=1 Tax=Stenotrophomonas sp. Iso1 TaxID=2977283 RepID=UPI0022B7C3AA|nr:VWA domain-containing protein [Stenotrophomonas sp. Iso1]
MKLCTGVLVAITVVMLPGCFKKVAEAPEQFYRMAPPSPPAPAAHFNYAAPALVVSGSTQVPAANTEVYERPADNPVKRTSEQPVSTFSVDVDTGSYSNVRRMLESGVRPPADAVRAEEFINYFDYSYAVPADKATPFRVHTELAVAPWDKRKQVMMIGIKGYEQAQASLPPMNLVFLIDTSGSMYSDDKLPLLKRAFAQLVPQLRSQDRVAIVAYAGSAGLVLEPTRGDQRGKILAALEQLQAGGSTNGGAGIELAYAMAKQSFVEGGANRVILATDGDFNVGIANRQALETLVADQRKSGVALTTLGFGTGNYSDAMAERLADVGDGNHAYIDSLSEARRVLVREMGSTLFTIARDVKIQVEFNPSRVAEYRLIGYENRVLNNEDFANDKVDAGDIGPGHEVTALYEIVTVGSGAEQLPALRYGDKPAANTAHGDEVAEVRLRYKLPDKDSSELITRPILASSLQTTPSESLRFASAVAGFADALRGGERMPGWSWEQIEATARGARGDDPEGERAQFIQLLRAGQAMIAPAKPSGNTTD